eukprot:jgi/Mesen1/235/ME1142195C07632
MAKFVHFVAFILVFAVVLFSTQGEDMETVPRCRHDVPSVRKIEDIYGESYGMTGLNATTIAGAVHHGMKELEIWMHTLAPGYSTPIHHQKADQEEVLLITSGSFNVLIREHNDDKVQKILATTNSSVIVPPLAVHQLVNDVEPPMAATFISAFSNPPKKLYVYKDWDMPREKAEFIPLPWDQKCPPGQDLGGKDEL